MPHIPFREFHLLQLLRDYIPEAGPIDGWIHRYFKTYPSLGSKDRAFIAETAYALLRWQSLLDASSPPPPLWENRYATWKQHSVAELQKQNLPTHILVSCPENLWNLLVKHYGSERAQELALINNTRAPTTVRVNVLKTSRASLLEKWSTEHSVSATPESPHGIIFHEKCNLFQLPEFREGAFEVQDEGSQRLASLVEAHPGQLVLDYCAGAGGKTLAFAPQMQGKGQIYLHDIRSHTLLEAKTRLKRAGVQNAQLLDPQSPHMESLKKKMDWVLVDAPCSGTGTLRRNPDMKWRFSQETLERLVGQQRMIFEKALSFVKPGGKIVYGTCSILPEENEEQVAHFLKTYPVTLVAPFLHIFPSSGGADGFFGAVFRKTPPETIRTDQAAHRNNKRTPNEKQ